MRGMKKGNWTSFGPGKTALLVVSGATAVLGAVACEQFARLAESRPESAAAVVLDGNEIDLVTTRFAGAPKTIYSSGSRFLLRISFDPAIVDFHRLKSCGIWTQDWEGGPWRRLSNLPARREAVSTQFSPESDGGYGLRVSAIYNDGTEVLVPTAADRPLVWLYIDRNPPKLTWISPAGGSKLASGIPVKLRWGASEMRFGTAPAVVDWSPDGGETWTVIERVRMARGMGEISWRPPMVVPGKRANPLVRLTAWDLVGNRSSAMLPLDVEGPSQAMPDGPSSAEALTSAASSPAEPPASPLASPRPATDRRAPGEPFRTQSEERDPPEVKRAIHPGDEETTGRAGSPPSRAETVEPPEGTGGGRAEGEPRPEPERGPLVLKNFDDGAVHPGGGARYIFFAAPGLDPERTRVTIEWRASGEEDWTVISRGVPAREGKFLWQIPAVTTAEGKLRLTAIDPRLPGSKGKAVVESAEPIRIDSQPPQAAIRGVKRGADGLPLVSLNCYDQGPAGLGETELFVTADGGASYSAIAVADPAQPVAVKAEGATLGFFVAAKDRVGNATPRPAAGTPPQETFEGGTGAVLDVESFEEGTIRGSEQRYLLWRYSGPLGAKALVEASLDGGSSWEPVGEVAAAAGKVLWISPPENCAAVLRVSVRLPDGSFIDGRTKPVRVDALPPQIEAGQAPEKVAVELRLPLAVTDPGGAGLESILAYVRPARGRSAAGDASRDGGTWTPRAESQVSFDAAAGKLAIKVAELPEGPYELFLTARDKVGNAGAFPPATAEPLARFLIDRTPVAIRALPTALPWVEGLTAAVQLEIDLGDAVPPLFLEERSGGGWTQILRWESLTPGEDLFRFPIPTGRAEYEVRFGVRDGVGNVSYAVVGPRPVERAIRLAAIAPGGVLRAGANQPIAWKLHGALAELGSELRVVVSHQARDGGEWTQLYDNLPTSSACVWTVPAEDTAAHRIAISLFHRGKMVGEDVSAPLTIGRGAPVRPDPKVVKIEETSLYYSRRADLQMEKYRTIRAQNQKWFAEATAGLKRDARGTVPREEMDKLSPDVQRQIGERERNLREAAEKIAEHFEKAITLDPQNYHAAYGMAQLLYRSNPEKPEEAARYLERTVEIKPDHAAALNDLGASRILTANYDEAEEFLRRACDVDDLGSYRYNLGLALYHQRKLAEARIHFEEALQKGGNLVKPGEAYYYIVSAYALEGNAEEAQRRLQLYGQQIPAGLRELLAQEMKRAGR